SAALKARAEGPVTLFPLADQTASRAGVKDAMLSVLGKVTCGDRVFLHFSGFSVTGQTLLQIEQRIVSTNADDVQVNKLTSDIEDGVDDGGELPYVADALNAVTDDDHVDPKVLDQLGAVKGPPL